jgi:hypothetical protein
MLGSQKGDGFMDVLKNAGKFIRDKKLISTFGSLIPHPAARKAAGVAGALGFGKKRKRRKRKAPTAMKGDGIISGLLSQFGLSKGKKKPRARRAIYIK